MVFIFAHATLVTATDPQSELQTRIGATAFALARFAFSIQAPTSRALLSDDDAIASYGAAILPPYLPGPRPSWRCFKSDLRSWGEPWGMPPSPAWRDIKRGGISIRLPTCPCGLVHFQEKRMGNEVSIADGNSRPRRGLSQARWRGFQQPTRKRAICLLTAVSRNSTFSRTPSHRFRRRR